uniref:ATP-dependent rRNA helicase rrp3 n=2 Tax=Schistocephalus solidus TaxID=70667 RepID=A0A0V0J8J2_SCHSO
MQDFDYSKMAASGTESKLNVIRLIGGEDAVEQAISLAWCRHHIIVATPGRLLEHMKQSPGFAQHHLSTMKHLVLDEADRMLSMEFADDIDALLNVFEKPVALLAPLKHPNRTRKGQTYLDKIQQARETKTTESGKKENTYQHKGARFPHPQTHLYTATMTRDVGKLRRVALNRDAVFCGVSSSSVADAAIGQTDGSATLGQVVGSAAVDLPAGLAHFCLPVRRTDKLAVLDWLVECALSGSTGAQKMEEEEALDFRIIVFCARCHEARYLAGFLCERGRPAVGLTGRLRQSERKRVLSEFSEGRAKVLVATDVASRGLDLPLVAMVINYGTPLTAKIYRHRVGRTARAGRRGIAVTVITRDDGAAYLELETALLSSSSSRGAEHRSLPRWPTPLPPEQAPRDRGGIGAGLLPMSTRRRLAEEAWSRAAKALRQEEERRLEKLRATGASSESEDGAATDQSDVDQDGQLELTDQHWASGAAGIEAARRAYAEASRQRKRRNTAVEEEGEELTKIDASEEEDEARGNLQFEQPIKRRREAAAQQRKKAKKRESCVKHDVGS